MTKKTIKGVVKNYYIKESGSYGYRPVWDTGTAAEIKKIKKTKGENKPSI